MSSNSLAQCSRCGIKRSAGGNTSIVCRDCRYVLTRQELEQWAA